MLLSHPGCVFSSWCSISPFGGPASCGWGFYEVVNEACSPPTRCLLLLLGCSTTSLTLVQRRLTFWSSPHISTQDLWSWLGSWVTKTTSPRLLRLVHCPSEWTVLVVIAELMETSVFSGTFCRIIVISVPHHPVSELWRQNAWPKFSVLALILSVRQKIDMCHFKWCPLSWSYPRWVPVKV